MKGTKYWGSDKKLIKILILRRKVIRKDKKSDGQEFESIKLNDCIKVIKLILSNNLVIKIKFLL
jgi:hypothetical protein